ncbi:MAG: hypothetical protein J6T01_02570 [Kiritimatiellae bacterium]|nr:hypothetical protein [Kiritimatiellia bacterium]
MTAAAALVVAATFTRTMERVATMDPAMSRAVYDSHAVQLVYETPLSIDYEARPYRLAPGFCEMPEIAEGGLVYVFRVREAELAAGFGAADMVRSLERLRDPELVSPNGWIVKDVEKAEAPDVRTVRITLKRRCHFFPWLMTHAASCVIGADGRGSGEFVLSHWRKNHEMVFRRKGKAGRGFDTVRYLVVDDVSTQWLMFLRGELDFLGEISRDNWDAVIGADGRIDASLERAGVRLYSLSTLNVLHLGINMKDPVLGPNRKLRQALNAAFDYPSWEKFYNGRIAPCATPVPPGVEGRLETPFAYAYDPEKARRLLAEAGYPGGIDPKTGRRLTLTLAIGRASQESREAGELMASFYARVGVRMESSFKTWDAFLKAVNDGRVQMFRMGWVGDYPDAQNFLQLFHSRNVNPGPNHSNYTNPEYDREYDAAMAAATAGERNRHWLKCQEIIREDCPWVFTHFKKEYSLVRPTVENYRPTDFPYGVERYYENALH